MMPPDDAKGVGPAGQGETDPVKGKRTGRAPAPPRPESPEIAVDQETSTGGLASSGQADSPKPSTEPSPGTSVPSGKEYVVARLKELNDPHSPWWTRCQGMGIRLRLKELLDLAAARHEGATVERAVSRIREETKAALLQESGFLQQRHKHTAEQLRSALDVERSESLPVGGLNFAIIEAAFQELSESNLRQEIVEELSEQAAAASDFRQLHQLDELIELLDSELAYDGFSPHWRSRVAQKIADNASGASSFAAAIATSIAAESAGWPKTIRFFIPIRMRTPAVAGSVTQLLDAEDVQQRLGLALDSTPIAEGFALDEYAMDFVISEASDAAAAVKRANDWLEQELALYGLQNGEIVPSDQWLAVSEDGQNWIERRPDSLQLMPRGLKGLEKLLTNEPFGQGAVQKSERRDVLADALIQLAQARRGSDGAALSDIWTVVEAIFAGDAGEPRFLAGDVMAELLEYLYPLHLLEWMGDRLVSAGFERGESSLEGAAWTLDQFETNAKAVFQFVETTDDPLLYVRSKGFGHWSARSDTPSRRMDEELSAVSKRCSRAATRAYLVRNFQVHSAQPYRATALAATLPFFAEMARVAVGYIAQQRFESMTPITKSKLALMRIRQVAWEFQTAARTGGGPLREAIQQDL